MAAGSDFSLEVGVRVKDDASSAFQRIGRSASEAGKTVESSGRAFGRFGEQAERGVQRSSQVVDGAARRWRTSTQRAGEEAGRAGGEGISRGVQDGAGRSSQGVASAAQRWRSSVTRAGEDAGRSGGEGIARGVGQGADQAVSSVEGASKQWNAAAGEGGGEAGETGGSALVERFKEKLDGLGEGVSENLGKIGGVVAGVSLGDFFMDAIDKASDLNETVSKSQAIFGEQAAAMQEWSQGAAQSMGLSSAAALDAATSFGDMFRQLGDSGPVASQTSQQVVQLAADLGSFNNLETGDVIERLSAAFRGEYDSLQAIIPNISAARVEQEALTETGKKSADSLTQQEKAHAVLAIVMKDGSRAMGDFERTAGGAANTAKRNAAAMDDLKAKVGSSLLSAFQALQAAMSGIIAGASALASGVGAIAHAFSGLPGPVQTTIGLFAVLRGAQMMFGAQIATMGARLATVGGAFRTLSAQQSAASAASMNLASNMNRSVKGIGAVAGASGGAAAQMGRFGSSIAQIGTHVPFIARAQGAFVSAAAGATRFNRSAGAAAAGASVLRSGASGLMGMMGGPLGLAFAGASVAAGLWAKHQQDDAQKVAEHKQQVSELSGVIQQYGSVQNSAGKESIFKSLEDSGATKAAHDLGISITDLTSAAMGNKPAMDAVNAAIQKNGMESAESGYMAEKAGSGQMKMTDSAKKVKGAVDGSNKAIREGTQSAKDHADAMKADDGANKDAAKSAKEVEEEEKARAKALQDTIQAYHDLNSTLLQQRNDSRGYQAAIDAATDSLKKNGRTLDEGTEAGRANGQALDDLVVKSGAFASSQYALHQNTAEANAILVDARKRYVDMAIAMGDTRPRAEIEKLANQLIQVRDKTGKPIDLKVSSSGVDAVTTKLNEAGKLVATLRGSKIEIPADTPNAPRVLQMMTAIKDLRLSEDGKSLTISAKALGDKETKAAIESIPGIVHNKDGSVKIATSALDSEATRAALQKIKDIAVTADGQIVQIPASVPNAEVVKQLLSQIKNAAVTADSQGVHIKSSVPLSEDTIKKLRNIKGVSVDADRQTVNISNSTTGTAYRDLQSILNEANMVDGKHATVTITTKKITEIITRSLSEASGGLFPGGAQGGNVMSDLKRVPRHARGNAVVDGVEYGWMNGLAGGAVRGPGSGTSDQVLTASSAGLIRTANGEHILTAREVAQAGGHEAIYRLRAGIRSGAIRGFASGGSTSGDEWAPDMSGIMAYVQSLKVDPSAVTDQRKKVSDQQTALNKAIRDLHAAQAGLKGKSGAARVKAENAIATAMERQAKASRDLKDNREKLATMQKGASADTTTRFLMGESQQNGLTKRFLDNIERIRKRGFPRLALSLLNQGDSDAQAIAQTLSGGALSRLKQADTGLADSDKLADRKKQMTDMLSGVTSPELTATAQQQANAQLISLQAANQRMAMGGGVVKTEVRIDYAKLASVMAPQVAKSIALPDVHTHSYIDGQQVAKSTTSWQETQSNSGRIMPNLRY